MKFKPKNKTQLFILILAVLVIFFGFRYLLVSSESHMIAFDLALQNENVQTALGIPIKKGFFQGGKVSTNADFSKTAFIHIPIKGSKQNAVIVGLAKKQRGNSNWAFSELYVEIKNKKRINLTK